MEIGKCPYSILTTMLQHYRKMTFSVGTIILGEGIKFSVFKQFSQTRVSITWVYFLFNFHWRVHKFFVLQTRLCETIGQKTRINKLSKFCVEAKRYQLYKRKIVILQPPWFHKCTNADLPLSKIVMYNVFGIIFRIYVDYNARHIFQTVYIFFEYDK